jgi:hypothetical protein
MKYIFLMILMVACAKAPAPQKQNTVLADWGYYKDFPLYLSKMKLNAPNVLQYDLGTGSKYTGTCSVILTLTGSPDSGTFQTSGGFTVYAPFGGQAQSCIDNGNISGTYKVIKDVLYLYGGNFGNGVSFSEVSE